MYAIQWGDVGTWFGAFATFAAVAYTLWHEQWAEMGRRPKLILSFDPQRDVRDQGNTVGMPATTLSRWLRVRVENTPKRRPAKGCRAYVVGVEKLVDGNFQEALAHDARPLPWMHDQPFTAGSRDIMAGVPHWVDVAITADDMRGLAIKAIPPWGIVEAAGACRITVQVVAEDADAETIRIMVRWNEDWQTLTGEAEKPSPR